MVDKAATVVTTEYGTASNPINNCSGTVYPGNPGTIDPEDPPKPDTGDNTIYTYAFEDQWPAYGDFDMNDVIITIDKIRTTNKDKQVSIQRTCTRRWCQSKNWHRNPVSKCKK